MSEPWRSTSGKNLPATFGHTSGGSSSDPKDIRWLTNTGWAERKGQGITASRGNSRMCVGFKSGEFPAAKSGMIVNNSLSRATRWEK